MNNIIYDSTRYSIRNSMYEPLIVPLWDFIWESLHSPVKFFVQTDLRDVVSDSVGFSTSFPITSHIMNIKLNEL